MKPSNETPHVSSPFNEDLNELRTHLLHMGGQVEGQLAAVLKAYQQQEPASLQAIIEGDGPINALEKAIDDECLRIIARRQPTASDLRLVFGITKIVTDLERCGDEIKKIAKALRRLYAASQSPVQGSAALRHMGEAALAMLRQALDALARMDVPQALSVIQADEMLDSEFKGLTRQLITHMLEDPRTITGVIEVMGIARAIERIGDHAKNIAEQLVYIAEGRDIRHRNSAGIQR